MEESNKDYFRTQTSILFVFSFLTASTYVFVRALAVSLFLARVGTDQLPVVLAISAFVVIGLSLLTRFAVKLLSTTLAAALTWVFLAVLSVLLAAVIGPMHHSIVVLSALFVFAEIRGCLNTIYVVTLSNECFAASESKKPFAIVASGAPVAGIFVGGILGFEASIVMIVPAIIVVAVLDGLTAVTAWSLSVYLRKAKRTWRQLKKYTIVKARDGVIRDKASSMKKYQFRLAGLVCLKIVVLTLIGYQWKVAAGNYFGDNETQLIAYFAVFYAVSDVLIVLLQWLVVGKLMDRVGIGPGLLSFPIAIALVAIAAFVADSALALLIVFTVGKGLNVMRRALHDPGLTVAYTILNSSMLPETVVFVKGIVKPFAEAVSACLLLVIGGVVLDVWITGVWLLFTLPWFYFAWKVAKQFRATKALASL